MEEGEFNTLAEGELGAIAQAVDDSGVDCDAEFKATGVLEITFASGERMIVNRHTAAREIWVAAKSGAFHFRRQGAGWVDTRSGRELRVALSALLSELSGEPVTLAS